MCRAQSQGPGIDRGESVRRMNMTATLQWLKVYWGASWSNMVIAPIPSGTCLLKPLIPMDQVPSNPRHPRDQFRESSLWELLVFFSQHGTHRKVWESIFPGGVCSVIYQFCRLS